MIQQKWGRNQIIIILKKIPMFEMLNIEQIKKIFGICSMLKLQKNDVLCKEGEESNHIYILFSGQLKALLKDGSQLSRISPLWTIGEMGVFSGEKRSATVIAESECMLLSIHKTVFFKVIRDDPVLGRQVVMNINKYLAHKLRINQTIIEELKKRCTKEEYSKIVSEVMKQFEE